MIGINGELASMQDFFEIPNGSPFPEKDPESRSDDVNLNKECFRA